MDKPDVDVIEGLSPAISIDQKSASRNPRSTVGTITEVYDYLRLLYARIGIQHCPNDGTRLQRQTPQQIVDRILDMDDGLRFQVLAPVVRGRKGEYDTLLEDLSGQGYVRARIDGETVDIDEFLKRDERLAKYENHKIEIVVDRLVLKEGIERRLTDSLETALGLADGVAEIEVVPREGETQAETLTFSQHLACPVCGTSYDEPAPRNFSFNSPYGACVSCDGLGTTFEVDPELIIPDPEMSLNDGAIAPWRSAHTQYFTRMLESVAEVHGIDMDAPWEKLTAKQQKVILHGVNGKMTVKYKNRYGRTRSYSTEYEGVIPWIKRRHEGSDSDYAREQYEGYMRLVPCSACNGARLKPATLAVLVDGKNISEVSDLPIGESAKFLAALELSERDRMIAERVTKEINARLGFLLDVGLDYLTLSRVGRHAGRWRGAAHPAGVADRVGPRRHAVRARRAVDRAPPARQPAADRHAHPAARSRQHGHRRRTRRGDDPRERLDRRHRSRRRRARRRGRLLGSRARDSEGQGVGHRAVPVGQEVDPGAAAAPAAGSRASWSSRVPANTTCATSPSRSRSATSSPSPVCPGRASRR